jgi:hypothetical protein
LNVAKTKALQPEENATLQALVRSVLDAHFPGRGGQSRFAEDTGVSQGHVSGMLNSGKGGGIQSLRALAKYRPVEVVRLLGISLPTLVGLWAETDPRGADMAGLPEPLKRAARAAVELWGCTPDEAHKAALALLQQPQDPDQIRTPWEWASMLQAYLPPRSKSGLRRKV